MTFDIVLPKRLGIEWKGFEFNKIKQPPTNLKIDCREVEIINSIAIYNWMKAFGDLRASNTEIRFYNVTPTLMKQSILTKDKFILPTEVISIRIPFYSNSADKEKIIVQTIDELKAKNFNILDFTDDNGHQYHFEEDPEEFFGIFKWTKAS